MRMDGLRSSPTKTSKHDNDDKGPTCSSCRRWALFTFSWARGALVLLSSAQLFSHGFSEKEDPDVSWFSIFLDLSEEDLLQEVSSSLAGWSHSDPTIFTSGAGWSNKNCNTFPSLVEESSTVGFAHHSIWVGIPVIHSTLPTSAGYWFSPPMFIWGVKMFKFFPSPFSVV